MLDFLNQLNYGFLLEIAVSAVPALLCITVHEFSHGLAAYALGDDTAKSQGRLSLNPFRHIDLFGLIMLAVVHFGWAKPVNVNPARFKNPKWGMAATALAGPASNFVFAGVCWLLARVVTNDLAAYLINLTLQLNIGLGIFNLIPFPPLDGSKVLFAFLPDKYYFKLMSLERYGMIVLIAVILALRYLGR